MIAEDLLLLALNDEKGTILTSASSALPYGLSGALLVELTLKKRLALHENKVIVVNDQPTGDVMLDKTMDIIRSNPKRKTAKHWINRLDYKISKTKNKLLKRLAEKDIVEIKHKKFIGIFPYTVYPLKEANKKREIIKRLREQILDIEHKPNEHTAVLGCLVYACNLTKDVFLKDEKKAANSRLKKLTQSEVYGKAVSDAVQAMQAAVMLACISAATVSVSSTSSS